MIVRKKIRDIKKYVLGTKDFSFPYCEYSLLYPVDLDFTLKDEEFYYRPLDDFGIPYRIYQSVGKQYNPTRIAAYSLAHFNRHAVTGDVELNAKFLKCANWFLNNDSARYVYHFDWNDLKAPWISCMAQGEAASVLIRAYKKTGDKQYLQQAEKALEPFFTGIKQGGLQSKLPDGSLFLEEYPSANPSHVLNGFLYALIGLGEFIDISQSPRHNELFVKLSLSVCKNIEVWCCRNWSLYEDENKANGLNFCTPSYHNLQITQLKWLNNRVKSPDLERAINSWEAGLNSLPTRLLALFGKIYFRLKNRAQR